jgi:ribokinase
MGTEAMGKIVVAGSLNMDLVAVAPRIPAVGETLIGTDYLMNPGGKGANQAFAAARLGGDVAMIGVVGQDDIGTQLTGNLTAAGCDVAGVGRSDTHSGIAMITVDAAGHNCIVVVPGANMDFTPDQAGTHIARLEAIDVLLLQLESPIETVIAAARAARAGGATVILDPAPVPPAPLPAELLANVDIVTPNEVEALALLGVGGTEVAADQAEQLAHAIRALGVERVVLKLGAKGCWALDRDQAAQIDAPLVDAVDSTAAGDTFNGGLAVGLAEGMTLFDACRLGVAAASLSVTKLGAQSSMPDRAALPSNT